MTKVPIANVFNRHADAFSQKFIYATGESRIIKKQASDEKNTVVVDTEKYSL